MKIRGFALSDVGRVRRENQDSAGFFPDRRLFVVADGMGGHAGGKQASELAVRTIDERFRPEAAAVEESHRSLVQAIREANGRIVGCAAGEAALRGMGTTLVALLLGEDARGFVVHVGDSRAYRLRDDSLDVLTADHSVVGDLLRNHDISEDEARSHPYRHVLTRALGAAEQIEPEVTPIEARPGDVFVLCSDGVSGMVSPDELKAILVEHRDDPAALCRRLIEAANAAGGKDNATAIAVRCD